MKTFDLLRPYFTEHRRAIAAGLASLLGVDILQLIIPRIIKTVIDMLTLFEADSRQLMLNALLIIGISVFIGVFRFFWRHCLMGLSRKIEEGIRNQLFAHLQTLSAAYFDRTRTGDLMAHATNDIHHIRMASGMGMVAFMDGAVLGSATIAFMLYINVRLTVFVLIPMPLIILFTRFFSKQMHGAYINVQAAFSEMTEIVRERFTGIRVIKAFGRQEESRKTLEDISKDYMEKNLKLVRVTGMFFPMMVFFSNVSLAIVLYLGGRQTIYSEITPGDFVAFISYLGLLTWPMMAMGWLVNLIQRGRASLERINVILNTRPHIASPPDGAELPDSARKIELQNLCFSYEDSAGSTLNNISLQIESGKTLGIIGPPGAGKTTLLQLIPRLYDPDEGSIQFDGKDIREINLNSLRSLIAFVPQEPFLFAGTIRENLTLGSPDIYDTLLENAVEQAALTETLRLFPKGLDTVAGEKGVILSGGQKQRVALARAFLRRTPVLILDDPISQVDAETGAAIIEAVRSFHRQTTLIIASHRMAAVRFCDTIITLKNGRITEHGNHESLIQQNGYYAEMHRLQEIEEAMNV